MSVHISMVDLGKRDLGFIEENKVLQTVRDICTRSEAFNVELNFRFAVEDGFRVMRLLGRSLNTGNSHDMAVSAECRWPSHPIFREMVRETLLECGLNDDDAMNILWQATESARV